MLSGQCFFFFEMLTIKYDRMALVNIEKLQTLTMQRWLQLFVCRSCTSTYWPGMPFLRLSYWRSHQIPTTRDLKKVPHDVIYSRLSLDGHLYRKDTSVKRTLRVGPCVSLLPLFDFP